MPNREEGVVVEYDGYMGTIKTTNKEYLLLKENIKDNKDINVGDEVTFLGEEVNLINGVGYIATFIDLV